MVSGINLTHTDTFGIAISDLFLQLEIPNSYNSCFPNIEHELMTIDLTTFTNCIQYSNSIPQHVN